MLDTIILELPEHHYFIRDEARFTPHAGRLREYGYNGERFINNATSVEKKAGVYLPKVTIIRRLDKYGRMSAPMRVEVSVPKLVYGNNVEEVGNDEEFFEVLYSLSGALVDMGIAVPHEFLKNAEVVALHAAKNIILPNRYTSRFILSELSKVELNKKMDLTKTDFREGYGLQYYSNSHSVAIYDKMADLSRPQRRAFDKGNSKTSKALLCKLKALDPHMEILRIEVRLSKKKKMQQVLNDVGYSRPVTLLEVVTSGVSIDVLEMYWDKYIASDPALLSFDDPIYIFEELRRAYPTQKAKDHLMLLGLLLLAGDAGKVYVKNSLSQMYSSRTWLRLKKKLGEGARKVSMKKSYLDFIGKEIKNGSPLFRPDFS